MRKLQFIVTLVLISSFCVPNTEALDRNTVSHRDVVIDLGDGLAIDAQLTYPSVGEGPFPGVLLVHGSGSTDMDEYLPPEISDTENGSRPFLQIAQYLSERGIAVLRYNKRGIGLKGIVLDEGVVLNTTFKDLLQDAEKVLEFLIMQPEVDLSDITILGHSEGTWIAPRIAINDNRVKKIVLMSAGAHNLYDILYFQIIEQGIHQFNEVDSNNDGLLSVQEVQVLPSIMADQLIENSTGEWLWWPGIDPNGDGYISLIEERLPQWNQTFEYITTAEYPGSIWMQSHFGLDTNLDIIGNVSASILILQGEEDSQTPVSEALLLEQKLSEIKHPDHKLITYPGLGHTFYPKEGLLQWLGPIQDNVLFNLADWLKNPARNQHNLTLHVENIEQTTTELQTQINILENQLGELQLKSSTLENDLNDQKKQNEAFEAILNTSKNLTIISLGLAIIAVVIVLVNALIRSRSLA
jgi:pimeloyl-ACP methyl ester carboxylesterase